MMVLVSGVMLLCVLRTALLMCEGCPLLVAGQKMHFKQQPKVVLTVPAAKGEV